MAAPAADQAHVHTYPRHHKLGRDSHTPAYLPRPVPWTKACDGERIDPRERPAYHPSYGTELRARLTEYIPPGCARPHDRTQRHTSSFSGTCVTTLSSDGAATAAYVSSALSAQLSNQI